MKFSRKKIVWLVVLAVFCGLAAGVWFGVVRPRLKARQDDNAARLASDSADMDRTFKVRRDDLIIGLLQGGYVNASQKHKLALQANYRTKLLWVIDENSKVKAGDLLAKFETDELKEQIENLEIELDNLKKELDLAIESKKIQISTNAAACRSAAFVLICRRRKRVCCRPTMRCANTAVSSAPASATSSIWPW